MPPQMLVLFDVSGGQRAGVGHVIRSLELATRLLKLGVDVVFLPPGGRSVTLLVERSSFPVTPLARVSAHGSPSVVLVDRPDTSAIRLKRHHQRWPRARLIALDYYGQVVGGVDAVINLNRWRVRAGTAWSNGCEYRQGLTFATLREAFRSERSARPRARRSLQRLFLAFGGTDPSGWTRHAIHALAPLVRAGPKLDVVVGRRSAEVDRAVQAVGTARVHLHESVSDPAALLGRCDVAVIGGGTMMMECACLGIPAVVVPRTKAERLFATDFAHAGAVVVVPPKGSFPVHRVAAAVGELAFDQAARRDMAAAGRQLIDGRGADRVVSLVMELTKGAP